MISIYMCIFEALYISDTNVNDKKEIKVNLTLNKDRDSNQKWKSADYKMRNKNMTDHDLPKKQRRN